MRASSIEQVYGSIPTAGNPTQAIAPPTNCFAELWLDMRSTQKRVLPIDKLAAGSPSDQVRAVSGSMGWILTRLSGSASTTTSTESFNGASVVLATLTKVRGTASPSANAPPAMIAIKHVQEARGQCQKWSRGLFLKPRSGL